jgi:flagellar basal-body rod protein FlgG
MSVQTLYTAATGMESLQTKLDVIANNLANTNTTGFKRNRANFEDNFYRHHVLPTQNTPTGTAVGLGVHVQSVQTEQRQGAFQETNNPLDVAIEGRGYLVVQDPQTGQQVYTRAGNLTLNSQGQIVVGSASLGRIVQPAITIPQDATSVTISPDGFVYITQPNSTQSQQVGQVQLALFTNPEGLLKRGDNIYQVSDASGQPVLGTPGQQGFGVLRNNMLETSNVEAVTELIDLITTQRAFEMNGQAIQAGDQILQLITNLRR